MPCGMDTFLIPPVHFRPCENKVCISIELRQTTLVIGAMMVGGRLLGRLNGGGEEAGGKGGEDAAIEAVDGTSEEWEEGAGGIRPCPI